LVLLYFSNKFFWAQQNLGANKIWEEIAPERFPRSYGPAFLTFSFSWALLTNSLKAVNPETIRCCHVHGVSTLPQKGIIRFGRQELLCFMELFT